MTNALISLKMPEHNTEQGNCGVVATAAITGQSYSDVWKFYARTHKSNWKDSLTTNEIWNGMTAFGARFTDKMYHNIMTCGKRNWTVLGFVSMVSSLDSNKVYVVLTRNHIVVIRGDEVCDQAGVVHATQFRLKGQTVTNFWELVSVEEPNKDAFPPVLAPRPVFTPKRRENASSGTKREMAVKIVNKYNGVIGRNFIIQKIMIECNMTLAGATSYYYAAKKELKIL